MIHEVQVYLETTPEALKKEFRKKLMTGGAVVALDEGVTAETVEPLVDRFLLSWERHSVAALVLRKVALLDDLSPQVVDKLLSTADDEVKKELYLSGNLQSSQAEDVANSLDSHVRHFCDKRSFESELKSLDSDSFERFLKEHSGESQDDVEARIALAKNRAIPDSIRKELEMDSVAEVRFAARQYRLTRQPQET